MTEDFSSQVIAELGELQDIAAWMHREARSLETGHDRPASAIHFGHHSPCGETHLARRHALSILETHVAGWDSHRQELQAIAAAVERAVRADLSLNRHPAEDPGR